MKEINVTRLAYLNTLGEKRPSEILLKIIEIECFESEFEDFPLTLEKCKEISKSIKEKYKADIKPYALCKWFPTFFMKENKKIKLKDTENLSDEINRIRKEEKEFLDKVSDIRKRFIEYAQTQFKVSLNNESAKEIFNNYVYSVASDTNLNFSRSYGYFIFQEFIKKLFLEDRTSLGIIENFGVANQIQSIVLNGDEETGDKKFLKDCIIFLDTPIVLKRLGYDGRDLSDTYKYFLDDLQQAGAKLKVYEHTLDEIWSILFNFKRCIAQNNFNGKGVITFLKARKEFLESNPSEELPLDRDKVKENIEHAGFEIYSIEDSDCLEKRDSYEEWEIDENELKKILTQEDSNYEFYETRLNKDIQSISATSRLRNRDNIRDINNYKDGKYYFLVDNLALIRAIKEYYEKKGITKYKNELLLENTVLFLLWQNLTNNDELNRALFRSKCFAINTIDEEFKDKLYRETRKIEAYNMDRHISEEIIAYPDIETEVYKSVIKEKNGEIAGVENDLYISKTINNVVQKKERELREKLNEQRIKMNQQENLYKEAISENEKELKIKEEKYKKELMNDRSETVEELILNEKKKITYRIKKVFYKLINKDYDSVIRNKFSFILKRDVK